MAYAIVIAVLASYLLGNLNGAVCKIGRAHV